MVKTLPMLPIVGSKGEPWDRMQKAAEYAANKPHKSFSTDKFRQIPIS